MDNITFLLSKKYRNIFGETLMTLLLSLVVVVFGRSETIIAKLLTVHRGEKTCLMSLSDDLIVTPSGKPD